MISFVKGTVADIGENCLVVENGGIGYEIYMTGQDLGKARIGDEKKIHTFLYVREDILQLYGFFSKDDLGMFKLLIGVNGVGPKGALGILSGISADELRFAVLSDDVKTISKAPGIGKKTAQKMILELKDKLAKGQTINGAGETYGGTGVTVIPENKLSEASAALAVQDARFVFIEDKSRTGSDVPEKTALHTIIAEAEEYILNNFVIE